MKAKKISKEQWYADEKAWWNKYGRYMSFQWKLTPKIHKILRSDLEDDYTKFLYKKNGSLLDIGCGSGWVSNYFAKKKMNAYGIDISQEQINDANLEKKLKGIQNVSFKCSDFISWDIKGHKNKYDSVFINAFLHHLPEAELKLLFKKLNLVTKPNGKIYLHEPIFKKTNKKNKFSSTFDFLFKGFHFFTLNIVAKKLNWYSKEFNVQLKNGYTMSSPHERPISKDFLMNCCKPDFKVVQIKGWYLYSLGSAMQAMGLKIAIRKYYLLQVRFWYFMDKLMFALFGWEKFSNPKRFILCSLKLIKK